MKKIIPNLTSKNICDEHADIYTQIDFLFRTLNNVVHDGESFYKDDSGTKHHVEYEKARNFFTSVIEVMKWLRNIDTPIAEKLKCFIDIQ